MTEAWLTASLRVFTASPARLPRLEREPLLWAVITAQSFSDGIPGGMPSENNWAVVTNN